jgi:hypothetical protein
MAKLLVQGTFRRAGDNVALGVVLSGAGGGVRKREVRKIIAVSR